jgi:hypothetical protein
MKVAIAILYLLCSFFAFGAGCDTAKGGTDHIGFKFWALSSLLLFIMIAVA